MSKVEIKLSRVEPSNGDSQFHWLRFGASFQGVFIREMVIPIMEGGTDLDDMILRLQGVGVQLRKEAEEVITQTPKEIK